jgi:hypothetical protein
MSVTIVDLPKLTKIKGNDILLVVNSDGMIYSKTTVSELLANCKVDVAKLNLDKVDNTRDLDKPLSLVMVKSLEHKANAVHTHVMSDVEGLPIVLSTLDDRLKTIEEDTNLDLIRRTIQDTITTLVKSELKNNMPDIKDMPNYTGYINELIGLQLTSILERLGNIENILASLNTKYAPKEHTHQDIDVIGLVNFMDRAATVVQDEDDGIIGNYVSW